MLAAAEKTTEHLRDDVMLRQQRIRWKRDIAAAAELQPAVDAIVAAIQEAHRKLAAAQAEHETTCRGLVAEHKILMGKMPNAAAAHRRLAADHEPGGSRPHRGIGGRATQVVIAPQGTP